MSITRFIVISAAAPFLVATVRAQDASLPLTIEDSLVAAGSRLPSADSAKEFSAARIPSQFDLQGQLIAGSAVSPGADSVVSTPRTRLLPANLSIMERAVWGEDGFVREIGLEPPLTPDERRSELSLRRTMLTTHQIGGFVTLGLMGGAVYFGQKIIDGHPEYRRNHQYWVTATIISYSATGLLAILSPPPMIRRNEFSTTTLHKTLAWIHVAGMIITPILGGMIQRRSKNAMQSERVHQVSAYLTTATFAASMIVVTF